MIPLLLFAAVLGRLSIFPKRAQARLRDAGGDPGSPVFPYPICEQHPEKCCEPNGCTIPPTPAECIKIEHCVRTSCDYGYGDPICEYCEDGYERNEYENKCIET